MTIKVYEVDREGRTQVLRSQSEVIPLTEPEHSHAFPACECHICIGYVMKTGAAEDAAYRTWLGHTQFCATCRVGVCCPTAVSLGRAWREARRG